MSNFKIKTKEFEGPIELLLNLIHKLPNRKISLVVFGIAVVLVAAVIFLFVLGDLRTYTNKNVGFGFKYPKEWGEVISLDYFSGPEILRIFSFENHPEIQIYSKTPGYNIFGRPGEKDVDSKIFTASRVCQEDHVFYGERHREPAGATYENWDCTKTPVRLFWAKKEASKLFKEPISVESGSDIVSKVELAKYLFWKLPDSEYESLVLRTTFPDIEVSGGCVTRYPNENSPEIVWVGCLSDSNKDLLKEAFVNFENSELGQQTDKFIESIETYEPADKDSLHEKYFKDVETYRNNELKISFEYPKNFGEPENFLGETHTISFPNFFKFSITSETARDMLEKTAKKERVAISNIEPFVLGRWGDEKQMIAEDTLLGKFNCPQYVVEADFCELVEVGGRRMLVYYFKPQPEGGGMGNVNVGKQYIFFDNNRRYSVQFSLYLYDFSLWEPFGIKEIKQFENNDFGLGLLKNVLATINTNFHDKNTASQAKIILLYNDDLDPITIAGPPGESPLTFPTPRILLYGVTDKSKNDQSKIDIFPTKNLRGFSKDSFHIIDNYLYYINSEKKLAKYDLVTTSTEVVSMPSPTEEPMHDFVVKGDKIFYIEGLCNEADSICNLWEYDLGNLTYKKIASDVHKIDSESAFSGVNIFNDTSNSGHLLIYAYSHKNKVNTGTIVETKINPDNKHKEVREMTMKKSRIKNSNFTLDKKYLCDGAEIFYNNIKAQTTITINGESEDFRNYYFVGCFGVKNVVNLLATPESDL